MEMRCIICSSFKNLLLSYWECCFQTDFNGQLLQFRELLAQGYNFHNTANIHRLIKVGGLRDCYFDTASDSSYAPV